MQNTCSGEKAHSLHAAPWPGTSITRPARSRTGSRTTGTVLRWPSKTACNSLRASASTRDVKETSTSTKIPQNPQAGGRGGGRTASRGFIRSFHGGVSFCRSDAGGASACAGACSERRKIREIAGDQHLKSTRTTRDVCHVNDDRPCGAQRHRRGRTSTRCRGG